jgi:hypothetical protein
MVYAKNLAHFCKLVFQGTGSKLSFKCSDYLFESKIRSVAGVTYLFIRYCPNHWRIIYGRVFKYWNFLVSVLWKQILSTGSKQSLEAEGFMLHLFTHSCPIKCIWRPFLGFSKTWAPPCVILTLCYRYLEKDSLHVHRPAAVSGPRIPWP